MDNPRAESWVVLLLILSAAAVNGVTLWVLNNAWIAIALCTILFYGGAIGVSSRYHLYNRLKIPPGQRFRTLGLGIASAVIVGLGISWTGSVFFHKALPPDVLARCAQRVQQSGTARYGLLPFLLAVSGVVTVGEEMYWRGGLQGFLRLRCRFGTTIIMSALCFTLYHLVTISYFIPSPAMVPFVISVFLGGAIFAILTERLGNIWAATICHGLGVWGGMFYLIKRILM